MFQLSFTFHAGMEAIGYEWGAPSYEVKTSPDDTAQAALASRYSWYGGEFPKHGGGMYPFGDMNGLVYPVRGGMEDWAYGASWDTNHTQPCTPVNSPFGEYEASKTIYDESTLRVFNMLVETSNDKTPKEGYLGSRADLFVPDNLHEGNGHVNRNLRLSLLLIDMVQPYVQILTAHSEDLDRDIIPATRLYQQSETCVGNTPGTGAIVVEVAAPSSPVESLIIPIEWTVGGAFDVDKTWVIYGRASDITSLSMFSSDRGCDVQPTMVDWDDLKVKMASNDSSIQQTESITGGRTRWHEHGPNPIDMIGDANGGMPPDPLFRANIDLSSSPTTPDGDDVWIAFAVAVVDSSWGTSPGGVELPPQSHAANARTNTEWYHESATTGKIIQGRESWISLPITFRIVQPTNGAEEDPEAAVAPIGSEDQTESNEVPLDTEIVGGEENKETYETAPKRDRGHEEELAASSHLDKSEWDEHIEGPSLSLLHLCFGAVVVALMGLVVHRIWTNKTRKRKYRKTGRRPAASVSVSEVETVALAGSDDHELDINEFESENPFANPDNEGEFVQYRDNVQYEKTMRI
jgi:hypothetical protein